MELLTYAIRPNGTSIWLPSDVMQALGLKRGDRLTPEQWESALVQGVVEARKARKQ